MSDEDNEELDSENQETEEVLNTENVEVDSNEDEAEDIEKLKEQNKRLFERAKKAEAKLKEKPISQTNPAPTTDADELRLIAKGLSDEEIEQAKIIAKGTSAPLTEAIKSPLFQAFQKDLKDQERKEKAKLSASKGSSQEVQKSTSDMSRDEHQRLAMEAAQNIQ